MIQRMVRLSPLLIAVVLAACEPSASDMSTESTPMPQSPPAVTVQAQERHLTMRAQGAIGDADWARIDSFLATAAGGRPEAAHLAVSAGPSSAATDRVVRHALALGYIADNITVIPAAVAPSRGDRLELTARTYVAVLPNCPQTGHLNLIDGGNTVSSDWGCAMTSMLGLQVADPHDLVRGRNGGETDGLMTTAAIQRMQADKVKKLESSSTQAGAGQ
jgi:pilus biogenesis lipoprotein CpaD